MLLYLSPHVLYCSRVAIQTKGEPRSVGGKPRVRFGAKRVGRNNQLIGAVGDTNIDHELEGGCRRVGTRGEDRGADGGRGPRRDPRGRRLRAGGGRGARATAAGTASGAGTKQ